MLPNWDDTHVATILTNIRQAMHDHSRLLIIEPLQGDTAASMVTTIDLIMLALLGSGHTRSTSEYNALFKRAKLKIHGTPTRVGANHLLEVRAQ